MKMMKGLEYVFYGEELTEPSVWRRLSGRSYQCVLIHKESSKETEPVYCFLFCLIPVLHSEYVFCFSRTNKRHCTLYDGQSCSLSGVCHIPMSEPFCTKTREVLIETAKKLGLQCHSKGTMITIEGPRFNSRAESLMFRSWGADVINMTTVPEVILAKEAGMSYASIAMATDYDCWKEHEEAVSVDKVLKTLKENANKATSILLSAIPQIGSMEWTDTLHTLKVSTWRSVTTGDNANILTFITCSQMFLLKL
ncbi:S-methyl-5'-thioadenosine phosphorylase [Meleagris gallopavo]|uniref:S-methyl-5'-thioadenosine phosphorylase n=1 Tax=Meleagris gallopavo TaxID=9103 RepID=UPI000938D0C4|nr:S-methyl-5'-thioadenosine phosphorylase [Meleagris gallopavo]